MERVLLVNSVLATCPNISAIQLFERIYFLDVCVGVFAWHTRMNSRVCVVDTIQKGFFLFFYDVNKQTEFLD